MQLENILYIVFNELVLKLSPNIIFFKFIQLLNKNFIDPTLEASNSEKSISIILSRPENICSQLDNGEAHCKVIVVCPSGTVILLSTKLYSPPFIKIWTSLTKVENIISCSPGSITLITIF